mmetsp:Transcript_33490/g.46741  ORF Transcript_33490/g.46741 Transcript_33490/m.46741 type:complete len:131 (-) Transcript_33490:101-493(-)
MLRVLGRRVAAASQRLHSKSTRNFALLVPKDDAELAEVITNAEEKQLLVIDWTATWCGPCRQIAPHFEALSKKHEDVTFLKCDVDVLKDSAGQAKISAVPSFHFVKDRELVESMAGADIGKLTALVDEHK